MSQCACCERTEKSKRFRPVALILNFALAWLILVGGGGTLINTGHPVAVEAGRLLHTVTFVEPVIGWADARGLNPVAHGLTVVSHGIPVG